jgi:probable HAF family extracellular repeat protein
MMKREKLFICAILGLIPILNYPAGAYYNVIDLGTLGGNASCAYSVNDKGQIVGNARAGSGGTIACLFDSTGSGANIKLFQYTYPSTTAYSINNKGQIVGSSDDQDAILFDPTGGGANKFISTNGSAYFINDNGWIVGQYRPSFVFDYYYRPCVFVPNGNIYSTIPLSGFSSNISGGNPSGCASAINDHNQIIGSAFVSIPNYFGGGKLSPCLFKMGNNATSLNMSEARSINDNGLIVGQNTLHACLINPAVNAYYAIDLGTLGGSYSNALSINNNGQIVGCASNSSGDAHACLFDSTGGGNNTDLNSLIDPSNGWTLTKAYDINNNRWIVGQGIYNGQERAFLLVVPEPVSALMMSIGTLFIIRQRKRS